MIKFAFMTPVYKATLMMKCRRLIWKWSVHQINRNVTFLPLVVRKFARIFILYDENLTHVRPCMRENICDVFYQVWYKPNASFKCFQLYIDCIKVLFYLNNQISFQEPLLLFILFYLQFEIFSMLNIIQNYANPDIFNYWNQMKLWSCRKI
jgi:hypothetical protein